VRAKPRSEPGSRSRRRRPGPERSREIVAAAREVFSAKGYEQASMAEIAARVGVVEGALYKHFASKRDLLLAVMRSFYESLIASLREGLRGVRGAESRLRFVIWSQLRAFTEEAGLCRVVIREIRPQGDYERSKVHELNRELTGTALQVIEEAVAEGELRSDLSPAMVRDVIYGSIEHIAWKAVNGRGALDVERTADALTELILRGIGARAAGEPAGAAERLAEQIDRFESALRRAGA